MRVACRVRQVDDGSFDEAVLASPRPALVHFAGVPCDGCPLAEAPRGPGDCDLEGVRRFCVDAESSPRVVARYRIADFPTVILLVGTRVTRRFVGRAVPGELEALLRTAMPPRQERP